MSLPAKSAKSHRQNRFAKAPRNYTKFPNVLVRTTAINAIERSILLYVSSMSTCFASHSTMAKVCGTSISSIQRSLQNLKKRNLLDWSKRKGSSCLYRIPHNENWNLDDLGVGQGDRGTSVIQTEGVGQGDVPGRSQGPSNKNNLNKNKIESKPDPYPEGFFNPTLVRGEEGSGN